MEERLAQFIAGLRAAGLRVSLAESADAFRAAELLGVADRAAFQTALRATLVKESRDSAVFDRLFPMFFGSGGPPLIPPEAALTPEQQALLQAALRALAGDLGRLLQMLAAGQGPSPAELDQRARQAAGRWPARLDPQAQITRQLLRQLGLEKLADQIEQLMEALARLGMTPEGQQAVLDLLAANRARLSEQVRQAAGQSLARQLAGQPPESMNEAELMQRPFQDLSEAEARELRRLVTRLAARLRSRAALRQKRGEGHILDAKATLRGNLRTAGVPFDLHFKKRRLKPQFALICDISTSMRPVAEFMLRLMYELQDQVGRARSFAFNDHLEEVSGEFAARRPDQAIPRVLQRIPPGYYATDLGASLADFVAGHLDAVDPRTTVIVLGDGRNNLRDPRLDLFDQLRRRSRRLVWFNPEPRPEWGSGDSDMLQYAPLCASVHQVSNLAELTQAVDRLFTSR